MGKKNKQKNQTSSENNLPNPTFAKSKVTKNHNKKAFNLEKKKNFIVTGSDGTNAVVKKFGALSPSNNFQISQQTEGNKGFKKLKTVQGENKQVVQQKPLNEKIGSPKNKKKKKNNVSKNQSGVGILGSPNHKNQLQNGSVAGISKNAKRKLKKQLRKSNQAAANHVEETENYIPLKSEAHLKSDSLNNSKKAKKSNFTMKETISDVKKGLPIKNSPVKNRNTNNKKRPVKNQSPIKPTKVVEKSLYSSSDDDDELDLDTSDEDDEDEEEENLDNKNKMKAPITINKQKGKHNIQPDLNKSKSDSESSDENDDEESGDESPVTHLSNNSFAVKQESFEKEDDDDDDENDTISDEEEDDNKEEEDEEEMESSEDDNIGKANNITFSKLTKTNESNQRKRKNEKSTHLITKKDKISNTTDQDEDDDSDNSEDASITGHDFIDSEAEEGNETDEDDDDVETLRENEEEPPVKKSKYLPTDEVNNEDENKVFINNIPTSTTEEDLRNVLSKAGNVSTVILPRNNENSEECRGFAFVVLPDQETKEKVIELDKVAEIDGQTLNIRAYKNKEGGGRGHGQGFRGGRGGRGGNGFGGGRGGFGGGRGGFRGSPGGRGRGGFGGGRGGFGGGRGGFGGGRGGFGGGGGGFGGGRGGFRGSPGGGGRGFRGSSGGRGGFRGSGRGEGNKPGGRGRGFRGSSSGRGGFKD